MGLLTGLLTLPIAPLRGTVWIAEQVLEQAEREFYDPATIRRQLEEVDRMRAAAEISEEEAVAMEDELVDRLLTSQARAREREA